MGQRSLTSALTHRGFRAAALDTWQAAVTVPKIGGTELGPFVFLARQRDKAF
jgi:hypothetical protein